MPTSLISYHPMLTQDFRGNLRATPKGPVQDSVYGSRVGVRPGPSGSQPGPANGMGQGRGMLRSQTYAGILCCYYIIHYYVLFYFYLLMNAVHLENMANANQRQGQHGGFMNQRPQQQQGMPAQQQKRSPSAQQQPVRQQQFSKPQQQSPNTPVQQRSPDKPMTHSASSEHLAQKPANPVQPEAPTPSPKNSLTVSGELRKSPPTSKPSL